MLHLATRDQKWSGSIISPKTAHAVKPSAAFPDMVDEVGSVCQTKETLSEHHTPCEHDNSLRSVIIRSPCQNIGKNAYRRFPEQDDTPPDRSFCWADAAESKNSPFTVRRNRRAEQIFRFQKLKPVSARLFGLINDLTLSEL